MTELVLPDDAAQAAAAADPLAAIRKARKPRKASVTIAADPADAQKMGELRWQLDVAEKAARGYPSDAVRAAKVTEAKKAVNDYAASLGDAAVITFHFESIGAAARRKLDTDHPATAEQIEAAKADREDAIRARHTELPTIPNVDPEGLADELIVATMSGVTVAGVDMRALTVEELALMLTDRATGIHDRALLFTAAYSVDNGTAGIDMDTVGKG